jgi:predicted alpha-1,6-mannanase (GH76 family)
MSTPATARAARPLTLALLGWGALACGAASPTQTSNGVAGAATAGSNASSGGSPASSAAGDGAGGTKNTLGDGGVSQTVAGTAGSAAPGGSAGAGPLVPNFPPLIDGCDIPTAQQRADSALVSLLVNFWSGADQYLRATAPANGKLTGYWTYAQAFDALLDGVERTQGQHYSGLIRAFYEGRAARGWLTDYYDDEAWMTLALMRAYDLTADKRYLDTAETIYKDIMTQWDTTCCGTHLGGIWWDKKRTQKATASNAGPALAGIRLAKRTNNAAYLDFAKKVYGFWMTDMVEPATFAIYDHLSPNGDRGTGSLTYNHGLMIGAALELNAATGEAHYLTEAHGFGHYLITKATRDSSAGPVLFDGTTCNGDCAAWKGIGYRYLAELYRKDPTHDDYRKVLTSSASALWELARDNTMNYFSSNWAGPAPAAGGVEAQGSAAMSLNQYAMLCGTDRTAAPPPAGVYQAEEGWVDHVDVEAHAGRGFLGFGYVSAFTKDKQGFTLDVTVAQAGKYSLAWLYTAGEGTCVRSELVNGQVVDPSLQFPATPSWTAWTPAPSNLTLPAGKSTIQLVFDSANGSKTSLDIDQLTVAPL